MKRYRTNATQVEGRTATLLCAEDDLERGLLHAMIELACRVVLHGYWDCVAEAHEHAIDMIKFSDDGTALVHYSSRDYEDDEYSPLLVGVCEVAPPQGKNRYEACVISPTPLLCDGLIEVAREPDRIRQHAGVL